MSEVKLFKGNKELFSKTGEKSVILELGKAELIKRVRPMVNMDELLEDMTLYLSGNGESGGLVVETRLGEFYLEYEVIAD